MPVGDRPSDGSAGRSVSTSVPSERRATGALRRRSSRAYSARRAAIVSRRPARVSTTAEEDAVAALDAQLALVFGES